MATALDSDLVFSNITIGSSLRKPNTHDHQYGVRVCACVRARVGVRWRTWGICGSHGFKGDPKQKSSR